MEKMKKYEAEDFRKRCECRENIFENWITYNFVFNLETICTRKKQGGSFFIGSCPLYDVPSKRFMIFLGHNTAIKIELLSNFEKKQ